MSWNTLRVAAETQNGDDDKQIELASDIVDALEKTELEERGGADQTHIALRKASQKSRELMEKGVRASSAPSFEDTRSTTVDLSFDSKSSSTDRSRCPWDYFDSRR